LGDRHKSERRVLVGVSNISQSDQVWKACFNAMVNGDQLRAARAWLRMSQDELASATGVARATIASFENGHTVPQPRTLRDLQQALEKAGIEFLFDGDKPIGIVKRG
jgi:DNA-binding XRE family transcriptional regulator